MDNQGSKIIKSLFLSKFVYKFTANKLSIKCTGVFPGF